MELPQSLNLYITFIEKEGPFLKVWGQTEKNSAIYVEQFLSGISPQFNAGLSKVSPESLQCGTLVCAKYDDNKYYRARLVNIFIRESIVEVTFIDFGNRHIISCENIRSLQDCPSSFISIPPLAIGFIFAEAHCVGGGEWNDTIFESISKEFRFREVQCHLLTQATQYYLVKLYVDATDLCNLLIQRGLMQPISLQAQQAVLLSMSIQRQTAQAAPPTQTSSAINTYKAVTLEPGCLYPVYVSYINDGPCHFSVQLKQTEDILAKLMKDINGVTLRLLEDVPIPGTLCLARCQEDGNVCRAVVTNEVDNQFKVYYVDFGNYEIVSLDSLFQIPFKYVIPKVMAIRYSLAGVEKSTVTFEMQVAFKKFVDNRMLHMKVLPTLTRVAVPKCELWDPENKTSALEVVNRAAQHAYPEPLPLNRGFSQPVKVSFVYSCNRFYVQLVSKEKELSNLMSELQEICQTNSPIEASDIKTGLPCCALFLADSLWYRSQVVEVLGETVKVRYIDYGNEEEVHITLLKSIDGEQLTVLRPQAIECCLNGYQNMGDDPERDGFLEEIILEDTFTMKVVEMVGKKVLVELFDLSNYNVASLLLDKIAAAKSQVSPMLVQAGNKIEHRKSQSQQREGPTSYREGYSQNREGQREDYRGDREIKTGRDDSNWNGKQNDRTEKHWRQDNRENRSFDRNSNDNDERNSWRDNNKGFSPNNQRQNRQRSQEGDTWNTINNNANSNSDWNTTDNTGNTNTDTLTNDEWNSPSNDAGARQNRRQDDYGKNKRGFDNDRGSKYDNDRGSKYDNNRGSKYDNDRGDRYAGKKWDGGYGKKPDYRKDDSQLSPNDSEQGYHKGPRTSSRNDRGGRGGGKFERNYDKPSFTSNSIGEDSWNVSAVVPSIDAAPVTASFTALEVIGTEAKVIISWFHHPCHFFCQIVDSQDQFKVMMEEIQEFYKNRKPEMSVVGAPVIGLFPEDNVLYRAQVLEMVGRSYKVYYVDFGNVSTIEKVWPIDMKFMNLPAQAIVCSLNGIAPLGDNNWSDPDNFTKYFEKENFTCNFINKDEEKTYVNILYETEDIAQLLIQDGLAVSTLSIIPDIEISLLLGQQFRALLKSVNNLSDIIIALECGLAVSCTMHNLETATETFEDELIGLLEQTVIVYVDNVIDDRLEVTFYDTEGNKIIVLNPDEGAIDIVELPCQMLVLRSTITGYIPHAEQSTVFIQPLEYSEVVEYLLDQLFTTYNDQPQEFPICPEEGLLYAVHSEDGNWYRGRVLSFNDEKATVCFVDYGNSEDVAFSELRELAATFLEISILCLQVTIPSDSTAFIDKEVTGSIYYGEEGWEGTIDIIESSATESTQINDCGDTGYNSSSVEKPDDVRGVINETSTPIADEAVVEVLGVDNLVIQDETTVPNIDEKAQFENVVPTIEDGEMQQHLDNETKVENVVASVEDGETQQHLDETEVKNAVDTSKDGEMQQNSDDYAAIKNVVPTIEDGEMQQHLDDNSDIKTAVPTIENGQMQQHLGGEAEIEDVVGTFEDGEIHLDESVTMGTSVYTSHIDSPNEFYVQFHDAVSEIEDLQEGIQTGAPEWSVIETPAAGIICAAPYSGDQKWYRAVILDADDDITTVRFMDFGNTDVIDNKTTQIKMLPPNLLSLAVYATRCSLKLEPLDEEWSANAITVFEELATKDNVTAEFLDQNEKTNYVELYSDGLNVREELIKRKLALTTTQTEETKSTGFVSHLNSPSEFWIQLENCVDELEWIAEQLSSAESFAELEDLAPGTLCAALFPDDTMWYRARILSNTVAGIELLFIDYGNSCTSSSLRQLPEDLVVTAPLAQKCSLQKPEGIPAWSPEAAAKFREISAEGQTIFTVKKISTGETSIVQLFIDEEDVSAMLLPDTEEGYVKPVDGLESLQIEKADGEQIEGSFQLEAMSGQELNEEAEQNFEQINKQGSTLFQIEFINNNTVRLYLNGNDIRTQLGGMKNASFDSSKVEEDFLSNEEVKKQTENKTSLIQENVNVLDKLDFNIQHIVDTNIHEFIDVDSPEKKTDLDKNRFFEGPQSDPLLPCLAASSSESVEEPAIVVQIEALPSVEPCHLDDSVPLPLEVDTEPTGITITEETESHDSIEDNSQTLNVGQSESPEASTTQNYDRIERSTQTETEEYENIKLSEIPKESHIVESPKECSPVSSSVKSPVANLNQEQKNDETGQDCSLTMNTSDYEPPTSAASSERLDISESSKKSSPIQDIIISLVQSPVKSSKQEFENDHDVQDSFQTSNNIEYEPKVSTASLEDSMLEEPTEKSSAVSSPVKTSVASSNQDHQNDETVQFSSQTKNASQYKPMTPTDRPEDSDVTESTKKTTPISPMASSNQKFQYDDVLEDSFQASNNIENEPHTSASLEEPVVEESPQRSFPVEDFTVSSPSESPVASSYQEHHNAITVQDSFQTLTITENEPPTYTTSPEESDEKESPKETTLVEDINICSIKTPTASSNQEFQDQDILEDSFQQSNNIENEPQTSANLEELVVEKSPKRSSAVSSPCESPVASSYQEHQNDDTLQDSFQTLTNIEPPTSTTSLEESDVRESPKRTTPHEDISISSFESPVPSSNQEFQNVDIVEDSFQALNNFDEELQTLANLQDSFQTSNNIENEPHTFTASLEESVVEESPKHSFPLEDCTVPVESPVKRSHQERQKDVTEQDSFQALDIIEYKLNSSSASLEETESEEFQNEASPLEDNNDSAVESPVASSNYEIQNDDTVQDSFEPLNYNEESLKKSFPVEDTTISRVKSPVASSNQEHQDDNTVQDISQIVGTDNNESQTSYVSTEELVAVGSSKESSVEDIIASKVKSPVPISKQDPQIGHTVQDIAQVLNSDKCDSPTANPEKSDSQKSPKKSSSDTYVAIPTIISPEAIPSSKEVPICSKNLNVDEPSPKNVSEGTEVEVSCCAEQQQLNAEVADHITENDNAVADIVHNSSDSGNESFPTTPQKNLGVAAPKNSPVGAQVQDVQKFPAKNSFDDMQGDIGDDCIIPQEKSLEEGELPNKIHITGPSALEIDASFEESTNNDLSEAGRIDASLNDLADLLKSTECESSPISPDNAPKSTTEMDITIPPTQTLTSSNQDNDTVFNTVQAPKVTDSDDYSESQELFTETNLSKLTISEQTSQEPPEGQFSNKNDEKEKEITITVSVEECSVIKPSEIHTDEVTQTPESGGCEISSSSSKKVKPSHIPVVGKDAKETSNKSSTEKVVIVSTFKSPIRVSLGVAKVLASKKDEISPSTTKKSKQAPSTKVTTVNKTLFKQASGKVEGKTTLKKPTKTVTSEPIKKSLSVKDDSPKRNAPGKAKTSGLPKKNSSNGANGPGTSNKGVINKEGESKKKVSTALVHNAEEKEEKSSVTNIVESDQICQDEDHKTEGSEVESSSLHSDLKEIKSVEVIEQE